MASGRSSFFVYSASSPTDRQKVAKASLAAETLVDVGKDIADAVPDHSENDDNDDRDENQDQRVLNHPLTLFLRVAGCDHLPETVTKPHVPRTEHSFESSQFGC